MSYKTAPIGALFDVMNGATPQSGNIDYWDGDIPWVTPADLGKAKSAAINGGERFISRSGLDSCGTQLVSGGSIILSIRAPIGHLAIAKRAMCFNQGCRGLTPRHEMTTVFAFWALTSAVPALQQAGQGTTFMELGRSKLRSIHIPFPDIPTQKRIAAFLDRETARIDELIAKKRQFIELAQEQWKATLNHTIFPNSPDWSRLPQDWRKVQLKYLTDQWRQIMYGIVLPGPNMPEGPMIVKGGDVKPGRLDPDLLCRTTHEIAAAYARSRLRTGDLVISIRGSIGEVELVPEKIDGANLTQDAARIAPSKGIDRVWLRYALLAPAVFHPLEAKSLGAAVRGINIFDLKRAYVPTPPSDMQMAIGESLSRQEFCLDALRLAVSVHSGRLREYRAALITAAVTGQIDVDTYGKTGAVSAAIDKVEEMAAQ